MAEDDSEYLGWSFYWIEDWSQFFRTDNWYTFNVIKFEIEDDRIMGGVEATLIVLGVGFRIRRNYTVTEQAADIRERVKQMTESGPDRGENPGFWTYDPDVAAYYFRPDIVGTPPYEKQLQVTAILDIAKDGTLAGVELVDTRLPPPPYTVHSFGTE